MKRLLILCAFAFFLLTSIVAQTWTTIKEKTIKTQTISLNESDTELCTLAVATTYQDGVVIFYCEAGTSDKEILSFVYDFIEKEFIKNYVNVFSLTSNIINDFRNNEILIALKFETDPIDYSSGFPCIRSHLYCASYIEKAARDEAKRLGLQVEPSKTKEIPWEKMEKIVAKYKTQEPLIESESSPKEQSLPQKEETQTTKSQKVDIQEELSSSKLQKMEREKFNISLLGGLSLQAKPIIDCNIKFYCLPNMFIVLQGGGTTIDKISKKITSAMMIPEGSLGIGACIHPFKSYKLNLFGYGSIGFSFIKLDGGYVNNGKYEDYVFYPMFRACVGIDFPITKTMCVSLQDCFDYLVNLGFNDHISAGITLKF